MAVEDAPASPCMGLCRIGGDGWCEGCWRTLAEITAWGSMCGEAKRAALARVADRRGSERS